MTEESNHHGERFPASSLTIGEDRSVVTVKDIFRVGLSVGLKECSVCANIGHTGAPGTYPLRYLNPGVSALKTDRV